MGVAGLWEILRPAGQVRSLTELAVEAGFNTNPSHQRGFRVGIDASIWFFHAAYGREGENPELRTLFFRCCRLLQSPLLPLFVFDGPNRPAIKRGKRVGGNTHWLTQGMKNIIEAFGFEWRVAPGEAEAELAYLNRIGIIEAVLSDDVDNFLFGATMVIRNPSNTLSGNRAHPVKNTQGKDDGNHVVTYTADAILSNPSVALSRSGTILIGLLSGGDYIPAGLPGCGQKFATGLARAGFGDSLMKAVKELKGARLDAFLDQWRQDIRNELRTNKSGLLPTKKPSLAASLPDDFPSLPVLMSYAEPLTSENTPQRGNHEARPIVWRNDPDPMRIASICELYFEWGVKDVIVHRFRTVLWPGIVCRAIRRVVMDDDALRRGGTRHIGSEDSVTVGPSSPTKQLSSTFSSITLYSPSKKLSLAGASPSDPSASESFTLASLITLISAHPEFPSSSSSHASGPSPLLLEVVSQRTHASTDSTLEYRVLVDPTTLVERAESGVKGLRPPLIGGLFGIDPEDENEDGSTLDQDVDEGRSDDDDGIERLETAAGAASKSGTKKRKARKVIPTTPLRLWLPACMVRAAAPALAAAYEEKVRVREEKKAKRGTKARRGRRAETRGKSISRGTKPKDDASEDEDESGPHPPTSTSKTATGPKARSKVVRVGVGKGRRKPKEAAEAQNDEYEFFDLSAGESPCSSDGESVNVNIKGKGKKKEKMAQTEGTNRKATTTNTMNEYFNTSKPSTTRVTMRKPSIPQPPASKASAPNPIVLRNLYEEEDSVDMPPLPKSSRPLDLLRAKRKAGTTASNPTTKSKSNSAAVPRCEEDESSASSPPTRPSSSKLNLSSLPSQPAQPAPGPKKKPLFVHVSDTDSDIEVSEVRRPLCKSATLEGDMRTSVGVGITSSKIVPGITMGRAVGSMVDFAAKGNVSKPKSTPSTSMTTVLPSLVRTVSVPLSTSSADPTQTARSASKLAHILLPPRLPLESEEEEGSEGDELPTFYCPSQSKAIKKDAVVRPLPQPFPIQPVLESPVSLRASRLRETGRPGHADEKDDCDVVEIVDVFTTPRGPSPPRSPTPSPSPVKPELAYASGGSPAFATRQSNGFPNSPTRHMSQVEIETHKKQTPRRHMPWEEDTPVSGDGRNGILKSPRKSAAHSSPRHVPRGDRRASSPTPSALSKPASSTSNTPWTGNVERCDASDSRLPLEDSGCTDMHGDARRKPRLSDTSAISISSGSEDDEGDAVLVTDNTRDDVCTDQTVDTWADTGMILSVPPSPAAPASDDLVPAVPDITAVVPIPTTGPARTSKFKPAPTVTSTVDVHAPSVDHRVSSSPQEAVSGEDTVVPRSMRRAPLLVARAKRSMKKDHDVIDLTSD